MQVQVSTKIKTVVGLQGNNSPMLKAGHQN